MRLIEGTPEEIAEYQRLTGQLNQTEAATGEASVDAKDEPQPETHAAAGLEGEDGFLIKKHVYDRARNEDTLRRVLDFLNKVQGLGTVLSIGESSYTHDGRTHYIMVRASGVRRFGAVTYVDARHGGLTLRLRPEDVEDLDGDERIAYRDVASNQKYAINCPLNSDEAVDLAVELTERALTKAKGQAAS